jgi:hypothetical protein
MQFQRANGLPVDGVVGSKTWRELVEKAEHKNAPSAFLKMAASALPQNDYPLTRAQARRARDWIMEHFGDLVQKTVQNSELDAELVCAIACKETAPVWLQWTTQLSPSGLLARCVFDASGDYPGTARSAFPRSTADFRERYGGPLTDDLIAEANKTRRLRGYDERPWVYNGYGIFQYDLQHISEDPDFFRNKLWYRFDACLERLMGEMKRKLQASGGDLAEAIRGYNRQGPAAQRYRDQVIDMHGWLVADRTQPTVEREAAVESTV